jgi:hypothetical protein
MATAAMTKNELLCSVPFLVRRYTCTGGATSANITHGEDRSPDLIFASIQTETPTVTTVVTARTTSDTTFKLDTLGDAADSIEVYAIWFSQASGGLNPP